MASAAAYLHLGVHRTGTSSFQQYLAQNRAAFESAGTTLVAASRDTDFARVRRMRLPLAGRMDANARATLVERRARTLAAWGVTPNRRLVLSEENLIGPFNAIFRDPPYPIAGARLRFLAEGLDRPVERVVLVIRSYDDFLISAYRKRCEFRKLRPFEAYSAHYLSTAWRWTDLVRQVQEALSPRTLIVVPYESRPDEPGLLAHLMPDMRAAALAPLEARVHVSATDAACREMQRRFHAGAAPSEEEKARIAQRFAEDASGPPVAAFTRGAQRLLRARYAKDLERLAADPEVELAIGAGPAPARTI